MKWNACSLSKSWTRFERKYSGNLRRTTHIVLLFADRTFVGSERQEAEAQDAHDRWLAEQKRLLKEARIKKALTKELGTLEASSCVFHSQTSMLLCDDERCALCAVGLLGVLIPSVAILL